MRFGYSGASTARSRASLGVEADLYAHFGSKQAMLALVYPSGGAHAATAQLATPTDRKACTRP